MFVILALTSLSCQYVIAKLHMFTKDVENVAEELKDQRVVTMMSPSELESIDDWMFRHRIRSRGDAIRRLCQIGMLGERRLSKMVEMFTPLDLKHRAMEDSRRQVVAEKGRDSADVRLADMELALSHGIQVRGFMAQMMAMQVMLQAMMSKDPEKSLDLLKQTEEYIDKMDLTNSIDPRFRLFLSALSGDEAAAAELQKLDGGEGSSRKR
jgi:hypothetical protein